MYRFLSRTAIAETIHINKRVAPFGQTTADGNSPSRHLGDYTHSHETVDKSTYSCYSLGECEVCSPLEKVRASLGLNSVNILKRAPSSLIENTTLLYGIW